MFNQVSAYEITIDHLNLEGLLFAICTSSVVASLFAS